MFFRVMGVKDYWKDWKLKYPVVLVHGLGAKRLLGPFEYFYGIRSMLLKAGAQVMVPDLSFWNSPQNRAAELKKQIDQEFPEGPINIIGHSMGGLDARYYASVLDKDNRVKSLTTIGTPNNGTALADFTTSLMSENVQATIEKVVGKIGWSNDGFRGLSRANIEKFNQLAKNKPDCAYFSMSSAIGRSRTRTALPTFWLTTEMLSHYEGDNDGFVSVESSKWGEHLATFIGDHYGQIGQIAGRSRGLNHYSLFDQIFQRLRREGF